MAVSTDAVFVEGGVPQLASGRKPVLAFRSKFAASVLNVREARLGLLWREEKLRLGLVRLAKAPGNWPARLERSCCKHRLLT